LGTDGRKSKNISTWKKKKLGPGNKESKFRRENNPRYKNGRTPTKTRNRGILGEEKR